MPIDLPRPIIYRPTAGEVRYLAEDNRQLTKGKPWSSKYPPTSFSAGLESNFKPYKLSVIDGKKLPVAPLKTMKLPGTWWRYSPTAAGQPEGYDYDFSPPGDKKTIIQLYRDGYVFDIPAYNQLLKTLEEAPHEIGEEEAKALPGLNLDYQDLRTVDCNGKRIIVGETDTKGKMAVYELIYDSYPACYGRAAICFYASPNKYKKYIKAVKACFKTIEWETTANEPHRLIP